MKNLLDYFDEYNRRIFPLQIVAAIIAVGLAGWALLAPSRAALDVLRAFLALVMLGIGIAFLLLLGDLRHRIPFAAYATAATYAPVVVILGIELAGGTPTVPTVPSRWRLYASLFMAVWAIAIYPLTGRLLGHAYPRVPLFGAMPCPTNIFAIGMLTALTASSLDVTVLFILSSMAVVGGVKAAMIGYDGVRIREDLALLASGLYGLAIGLGFS
jgi:hypothetical protein